MDFYDEITLGVIMEEWKLDEMDFGILELD